MAADTGTPNRVKKLFSSFLSSLSSTAGENETPESSKLDTLSRNFASLEETVIPDARNRRLFYERVETFSPLTWFAKPSDLSPLVCARYGWENVEYDMLQCVNCKAFLCGQLPKEVDSKVYRESCNKLKKNLTESHQKLCKWSSSPCPESFLCVPFHDREEVLNNFWFRVTSLQCARIPLLAYSSIEDKGITKESMCVYAEAVRCNDEGQRDIALDVIVCALCGWLYSESQVNILQCNLCRRKIGLWNYNSESTDETELLNVNPEGKNVTPTNTHTNRNTAGEKTGGNKSAVKHSGINGSESENVEEIESFGFKNGSLITDTRGTSDNRLKDSESKCREGLEDQGPERKRPRLEKQSFDPIAEHRYWCPWLQSESLIGMNLETEHVQSQGPVSLSVSPEKLPSSAVGNLQSSPAKKSFDDKDPAWLLMTRMLSNTSEDFHRQIKQSPQVEGLRHLRKVLRQCTSPTSPTKLQKS